MNHPGLHAWLLGDDRGLSSNTIAARLTGVRAAWECEPADPGDFGRCERLLRAVPTLRPLMPQMAAVSPEWARLVDQWDLIVATMEREVPGCFDRDHRRVRGSAPEAYALIKAAWHA